LLEELLASPGAPAMLTLLSFRSEELAGKPFLRTWVDRTGSDAWSAVSLEPMTDGEAQALIRRLLPSDSVLSDDNTREMTREAAGSPFVLEQLALYAGGTSGATARSPTFSGMFASRLGALPSNARLFLETLAVCGRPVAPEIVCDACGVPRERQSLLA